MVLKLKFEQILIEKIRFKVRRRNLLRHPLFKYNSRSFECNFRSSNETGEIKDKECLDYLLTVGKFSKWDLAGQIKFDTLI